MNRKTLGTIAAFFALLHCEVMGQAAWHWTLHQYSNDTNGNAGGLHLSGGYEALSNAITNETMGAMINGDVVTKEMTASLAERTDRPVRLKAYTSGELWFRVPVQGKWRPLFTVGLYEGATGSFQSGFVQLALRGNGAFSGKTMDLGSSRLQYLSHQWVGGGVEYQNGASTFGAVASLIKASRYSELNLGPSNLYTAPDGTEIEAWLDARYTQSSTSQPRSTAWYGTGVKMDLYYVHQPRKDGPMMSLEVKDLGHLFFAGATTWTFRDSLVFNGVESNELFEETGSASIDLDSLTDFIGFDRSHEAHRAWLPMRIEIQYLHPLGENLSARLAMRQHIVAGPPRITGALAYRIANWFSLEPVVHFGGYTRFDIGLNAALTIQDRLQFLLRAQAFEHLMLPENSTSQALLASLNLKF